MKNIKIIVCRPNEKAVVTEIEDKLEVLQQLVEGYIELCCPFEDNEVGIICNEEGKFNGCKPNRAIYAENKVIDIIFGTMLIVGLPENSESFGSLTDEQTEKYLKIFESPLSNSEIISFLGGED